MKCCCAGPGSVAISAAHAACDPGQLGSTTKSKISVLSASGMTRKWTVREGGLQQIRRQPYPVLKNQASALTLSQSSAIILLRVSHLVQLRNPYANHTEFLRLSAGGDACRLHHRADKVLPNCFRSARPCTQRIKSLRRHGRFERAESHLGRAHYQL
jgi:hypothetical protein